MNCAKTIEGGLPHPIPLSITILRPVLITRVPQRGVQKGPPLQIGKHLGPCYGFMENVHTHRCLPLNSTNCSRIDSWRREEYSQVRFPRLSELVPN